MWGRCQLIRHCVSSPDSYIADKCFLVLSNHLRFGHPLLLFHGTSIYHHHSLAHTFFFSSQYMTMPLQTTFMHFLDISATFAIPLLLSFLILSSLVTPLIHLNTLIYVNYCDFFTAHVHWFLPEFSLLHTYPVLSLHNHLAVPSPYCTSRLLDEVLYRTPSLFLHTFPQREYCFRYPSTWHKTKLSVPKPSLNNHFPNLQSISASSLCNPHNHGCLTPLNQLVQSDLSTPLLYSPARIGPTLYIVLITCQSLLLPNTYTHPLESHRFPLALLSSFVITLLFIASFLPIHCANHHLNSILRDNPVILSIQQLIKISLPSSHDSWGAMAQRLGRATDNRVVAGSNPTETAWKLWQFPLPYFASVFRKRH